MQRRTNRKQDFLGLLAASVIAISVFDVAEGAEYFMTPLGAGSKDGSSWENAYALSNNITHVFNNILGPGDTLNLGSGTYPGFSLFVNSSGTAGNPKRLLGVDTGGGLPLLQSNWDVDTPVGSGGRAIQINPGKSYLDIANLQIRNYEYGIRGVSTQALQSTDWTITNVDMAYIRHGTYMSYIDNLIIQDSDLKRYRKQGFRINGGSDNLLFRNNTADATEGDPVWESKTESLPFGFIINGGEVEGNTNVTFEDSVAKNNLKSGQAGYANGDGFAVEQDTTGVVFRRTIALDNQDGGYDIKAPGVVFENAIAIRNKRGFRLWNGGELHNSFGGYSSQENLWVYDGDVVANQSTFFNNATNYGVSSVEGVGRIDLNDSILAVDGVWSNASLLVGVVNLNNTIKYKPGTSDNIDPDFVNPHPAWNGLGNDMDSQQFPDVGYRSVLESIPGDFDGDFDVDGNDFLLWQRGDSPAGTTASDLAKWQANFGTLPAPIVWVPEPATDLLVGLLLSLGMGRRRPAFYQIRDKSTSP